MPVIATRIDPDSSAFADNREHMLGLIGQWRALEQRTRDESAKAAPLLRLLINTPKKIDKTAIRRVCTLNTLPLAHLALGR